MEGWRHARGKGVAGRIDLKGRRGCRSNLLLLVLHWRTALSSRVRDEVAAALPLAGMQFPCGQDRVFQTRVSLSDHAAVRLVEVFLVPLESGNDE